MSNLIRDSLRKTIAEKFRLARRLYWADAKTSEAFKGKIQAKPGLQNKKKRQTGPARLFFINKLFVYNDLTIVSCRPSSRHPGRHKAIDRRPSAPRIRAGRAASLPF